MSAVTTKDPSALVLFEAPSTNKSTAAASSGLPTPLIESPSKTSQLKEKRKFSKVETPSKVNKTLEGKTNDGAESKDRKEATAAAADTEEGPAAKKAKCESDAKQASPPKTPSYPLTRAMIFLELPITLLGTIPVHLYPSPFVKATSEAFFEASKQVYGSLNPNACPGSAPFNQVLTSQYNDGLLKIDTDTTLYLSEAELPKFRVTIENNGLLVGGEPLGSGIWIYVIDESDQMYITEKKITPQGRLQHSSLSAGKPVFAAGFIEFTTTSTLFILDNHSGHYRTSGTSIDYVLEWFRKKGLKFEAADTEPIKYGENMVVRNTIIELKT